MFQVNSTQIRLTTPPGTAGFATITVTNPSGENDSLTATFQYVAPPTVLSVLALDGPTIGENRAPIAGNVTVEIKGTGFRDGLLVRINGFDTLTTFVDDTTARANVPSAPADSTESPSAGVISERNPGPKFPAELTTRMPWRILDLQFRFGQYDDDNRIIDQWDLVNYNVAAIIKAGRFLKITPRYMWNREMENERDDDYFMIKVEMIL